MHLHNSDVLTFLESHADNLGIMRFLEAQDKEIVKLNEELGDDYKDYLDYLARNIGDDASFTLVELKALVDM